MAKGFDGLIEYLLEEIALCGEIGASSADFRRFVQQYYTLPDQNPAGLTFGGPETAQLTPVLDNKLYEKVWQWLTAHPDVWVGDGKKCRTFTLAGFEALEAEATERQNEPAQQDQSPTESNSTPNLAAQGNENENEIVVSTSASGALANKRVPGSSTRDGQRGEPPASSTDRNENQTTILNNTSGSASITPDTDLPLPQNGATQPILETGLTENQGIQDDSNGNAPESSSTEHGSRSSLQQVHPNQGTAPTNAQRIDSSKRQSPAIKPKGRKPWPIPAGPPKDPVPTALRVHTNKERIWQAIAGHSVDYKRVPLHEFVLLSIIAAQGEGGIIQPELTKLSGQDKRSTPHRTDQLAAKGYIEKKSVNIRGFRTSLCTHRKFVGKSSASQHVNENSKDVFVDGTLILDNLIWYLYDLLRDIQIVSLQDLRRKLGIEKVKQWQGRALANALIRLDAAGFIKRVKAKVKGSENEWLRCIKLLRMPNEDDHQALNFGQRAVHAGPSEGILEEDQDGDEEMRDLDLEADYGDWNMLENEEDEVEEITRIPPQWNLDQPLNNFIFDAIQAAGPRGGNSAGIRDFSMGKFWRRSLETTLAKLTDNWQKSQPPHLKHFTVIRDTAITTEKRYIHYIYRTYDSFQQAIDAGEASWEAVKNEGQSNATKKDRPSKKPIEQPESNLDEWGFPKLSPKLFHGRNGTSTLKQCRETIVGEGFRTVWDTDLLNRLGHARKVRRGRPPKQPFPHVDSSLQTPEQITDRRQAPSQPSAQRHRDAVRAKREANRIRKAAEELALKELEAAARKRDSQVAGLNNETQENDDPRIEIPDKPRKRRILTETQRAKIGLLPRKRGRPPKSAYANREGSQNDGSPATVETAEGNTPEPPTQISKKRRPRQPKKTVTAIPTEDQDVVEVQDNTSLNANASMPVTNDDDVLPQTQNENGEAAPFQIPKKKRGRKPKNSALATSPSNQEAFEDTQGNAETNPTTLTGGSVENDPVPRKRGRPRKEQGSAPKRARLNLDRPTSQQSSGPTELNATTISSFTPINGETQAATSPTQVHTPKKVAVRPLQTKKAPRGRVRKTTRKAIDAERTIAALTEIEGSDAEPAESMGVEPTRAESAEEVNSNIDNLEVTPSGAGSADALPAGVEPNEFENRVQEIIKLYTDRSKPGIYVNPFITRKVGGRGRPRKALMAIFKSGQLHELDWFGPEPQLPTQSDSARSLPSVNGASPMATAASDAPEMRPAPVPLKRKAPRPRKRQEPPSKKPRLELETIGEGISRPEQNLDVPETSTPIEVPSSAASPAPTQESASENPESALSTIEHHPPNHQGSKGSYDSPYGQEINPKKPYRSPYGGLDSTGATTQPSNFSEPSASIQSQGSTTFVNGLQPSRLAVLETAETGEPIASATETTSLRPTNNVKTTIHHAEALERADQNRESSSLSAFPPSAPQEVDTGIQISNHSLNGTEISELAPIPANSSVRGQNGQKLSTPLEVPEAQQNLVNIPDAEIVELPEVKSTQVKKRGVVLGGGSINLLRNRIILGILENCNGVYPGAHEIQAPFYTTWDKTTRNESMRPDRATLYKAIKGLIDTGKIRKLVFTYQTQSGMTLTKNILTLSSVDPLSTEVKSLQEKMIEAHPSFYYPPQVNDLLGDLQARGHHRNFEIETEVTVERLYPAVGRLERRIRLSKEEREERRKEAVRRAYQKRREKQISLRDSLQASLQKRKPGRPRIVRLDRLEDGNAQAAHPQIVIPGQLAFIPRQVDPLYQSIDSSTQILPSHLLPTAQGGSHANINASFGFTGALPNQARLDDESDGDEASQAYDEDNFRYMNDLENFQVHHSSESDGEGFGFEQAFAESENLEFYDDRGSMAESPDTQSISESGTESEIDGDNEHQEDQEANMGTTQIDYSRVITFDNAPPIERSDILFDSAAPTFQIVQPTKKYTGPIWDVKFGRNLGPKDFDQDYELQHITTLTDPDIRFHPTTGTFSTEFFVERNARISLWRYDQWKGYRDARPQSLTDITSQRFGRSMPVNWYDQRWMRDEGHGRFFSDVHHVMVWEHEYDWLPEPEEIQFINHFMPGDHITTEETGSNDNPIVIEEDVFIGDTGALNIPRWIHYQDTEKVIHMAGRRPAVLWAHVAGQIPAMQRPLRILDSSQNVHNNPSGPKAAPTPTAEKRKRKYGQGKSKAKLTTTTPPNTSNNPLEILRAPPKRGPRFKQYKTSTSVCHIDDVATKKLLYTIVVVRTLAGGVEQIVSWGIVREVFRNHPNFDLKTFKACWKFIQCNFYSTLQKLTEVFQDAFIQAYETGEVPNIDYENLETYDWDRVIEWTQRKFKALPELDELPADRQALEKAYVVEAVPPQNEVHENYFRPIVTNSRREHFLCAHVYALPLHSPKSSTPQTTADADFARAKSWIQANIATPESRYNARAAYDKLAQLGEPLIEKVLRALLKNQLLKHQKAGRELPGRNYEFAVKFIQGFKRGLDVSNFWEAVTFKQQLDEAFKAQRLSSDSHPSNNYGQINSSDKTSMADAITNSTPNAHPAAAAGASPQGDLADSQAATSNAQSPAAQTTPTEDRGQTPSFPLSPAAPDGALMALSDLLAHNRVKLVPRLPPINNEFGAPLPRLSIWGFTEGHYKTIAMDRSRIVWDTDIVPTPHYRFGSTLASADAATADAAATGWAALPSPPTPDASDPTASIPLWCDIGGGVVAEWWERCVCVVLQFVALRAGARTAEIANS